MKIKERFSDEHSLLDYIHQHMTTFLNATKSAVGELEAGYLQARKETLRGWLIVIGGFVAIWFSFYFLDEDSEIQLSAIGGVTIVLVIILSFFAIYKGWRKIKNAGEVIAEFNRELNKFLWPMVLKIFSLESEVVPGAELWSVKGLSTTALTTNQVDMTAVLHQSELITEQFNTSTLDDVIVSSFNGQPLKFAEFDIKHVTGSGKNRQVKLIFKGYFVEFDLDINLKGKTFVSTDGDRNGFGHQSFWNAFMTKDNEVHPTKLEWNQFEKLLHVASSDPTEARYVLSPSFMNDLYTWWNGRKSNIRISFIQDKMYMLFPDKNIQLGRTVSKLTEEELLRYLEKIAPPMLHILHLVEDVQLQFNR